MYHGGRYKVLEDDYCACMDEQDDEAMVDLNSLVGTVYNSQCQKSGEIDDHKNVKNSRITIKSNTLKCPAGGRCIGW